MFPGAQHVGLLVQLLQVIIIMDYLDLLQEPDNYSDLQPPVYCIGYMMEIVAAMLVNTGGQPVQGQGHQWQYKVYHTKHSSSNVYVTMQIKFLTRKSALIYRRGEVYVR